MRLAGRKWLTFYYLRQRLMLMAPMLKERALASGLEMQRPFFIIGSPRSGTTLFRAMLVKSGELCIPPESMALPAIAANYKLYSFLPWDEVVKSVLGEFYNHTIFDFWQIDLAPVYREARRLPVERQSLAELIDMVFQRYCKDTCGKALRWGDKTPYNYVALPQIHEIFPNAQFIHLVRDGRDCAVSVVEAKLADDIRTASMQWVAAVSACRNFGCSLDKETFIEVRYEDLVQSSVATLERVCAFLEMQFAPHMLDFHEDAKSLGDSAFPYHVNLGRPLFSDSIGRWKRRLKEVDQAAVMELMEPLLADLSYI